MLKPIEATTIQANTARFAIVASRYNAEFVDSMLQAAVHELEAAGAAEVRVVRVPGAYEVPVVARRLAKGSWSFSAVICLGVILRGETTHAQFIGEAVSSALMQIQLDSGVPIIHEVLLLENREQARVRCLDKDHNRGAEAAQTALAMAKLMADLNQEEGETTQRLMQKAIAAMSEKLKSNTGPTEDD